MEVTWTDEAITAYEEIINGLSRFSARAAAKLSEAFIRAADRLWMFPRSGPAIPEFNDPDLREVYIGRYRLWYRLMDDEIRIITIWPAALPVDKV